MLYIKENSRELIEEYMDDITYLEHHLHTIETTSIFIKQLRDNMSGNDYDIIDTYVDKIECELLMRIEKEAEEFFSNNSTIHIFCFDALSIEELHGYILETIEVLTNRIMAILKRSR